MIDGVDPTHFVSHPSDDSESIHRSTDKITHLGGAAVGLERGEVISETGSYENGWGFFDRDNPNPDEFEFAQNDDLFVDAAILGLDRQDEFSKVDRRMPLDPARRKTAEEGICLSVEAKWGLEPGILKNIRKARNYLQKSAAQNPGYLGHVNAIHYQNMSMLPIDGSTLADKIDGHGDYLYFGNSSRRRETSPDKLDDIMRIYVYTPPEYNGHIAAEVIKDVREQLGRELYLKLDDCSTKGEQYTGRIDSLIIYGQTHGEMTVIAETLRKLSAAHPEMFDAKANPLDVARKTDIPGVSLAEEPAQDGVIVQSFNESRDIIRHSALEAVYRRYFQKNPKVAERYGVTFADTQYSSIIKKGEAVVRERYNQMDTDHKAKFHSVLKRALREEVQKQLNTYGIDPRNFAMNQRPTTSTN